MLSKLKEGVVWLQAVVIWFIYPSNRRVGVAYVKAGLEMAKKIAESTKTKKDDLGVAYLATLFSKLTSPLSDTEAIVAVEKINEEKKGALKNLKLGYSPTDKKVKASFGLFNVAYDPTDGSAKFGIKL